MFNLVRAGMRRPEMPQVGKMSKNLLGAILIDLVFIEWANYQRGRIGRGVSVVMIPVK